VEESSLSVGEIDFYEGPTFMFRRGQKPYQVQG
jgi:hypothetical protein